MAIIPENAFPGKITPANVDYPLGEARDITVSGDGTGTPWKAIGLNDLYGLMQAILGEAGIVASGSPDTALVSQYLDGIKTILGVKAGSIRAVTVTGLTTETDSVIIVTSVGAGTDLTLLDPSAAGARMVEIFRPFDDPETFDVNLLPATGTIGGQASISLLPGEGYRCFPDGGTDYILRAS